MISTTLLLLFFLCLANAPLQPFASAGWQTETVDSAWDVGHYPSLAFNEYGNPAISYSDWANGDLKYAHFNGTTWVIEIVDSQGRVGSYPSLAFDASGNPCISYSDWTNDDLKYAHFNGTTWVIETVDSTGWVGDFASLAFDASGNPAISYLDYTNHDLKYVHFNGATWDKITIDFTGDARNYVACSISLAFDASGYPSISYYDFTNGDLKFAHFNGTTWGKGTVDNAGNYRYGTGYGTSLAFDASGNPAISSYGWNNGDLKHARFVPDTISENCTNGIDDDGDGDTDCEDSDCVPCEELKRQFSETFGELIEVFRPIYQPVVETNEALQETLEEAINAAKQLPGPTERKEIQFRREDFCLIVKLICILIGVPCLCIDVDYTDGCFSIDSSRICIPTEIKQFEVRNSPKTIYQLFSFDLIAQVKKPVQELFTPGDKFITNIPFMGSEPSFSIVEVKSVIDPPEFGIVELSITGVSVIPAKRPEVPAITPKGIVIYGVLLMAAEIFYMLWKRRR